MNTDNAAPVDPHNVLQWRDGFWCFQEELSPAFLRDDNYRVVLAKSDEWLRIISEPPPSRRLTADNNLE